MMLLGICSVLISILVFQIRGHLNFSVQFFHVLKFNHLKPSLHNSDRCRHAAFLKTKRMVLCLTTNILTKKRTFLWWEMQYAWKLHEEMVCYGLNEQYIANYHLLNKSLSWPIALWSISLSASKSKTVWSLLTHALICISITYMRSEKQ